MNLEENKRRAIAFYKTAYEGEPKKAIDEYFSYVLIQTAAKALQE